MKESYADLKLKLEKLVEELENPTLDIDEAVKLHKEAEKTLQKMEKYLTSIKETLDQSGN